MTEKKQQNLEFCEVCEHNKYTVGNEIICRLTGKAGVFEEACPQYSKNTELKEFRDKYRNQELVREKTADIGLRLVNFLIDSVFIFVFVLFITLVIKNIPNVTPDENVIAKGENKLIDSVLYLLLYFTYYFVLEVSTGRTFAKFITKTKVVSNELKPPGFRAIIIRTLCRSLPFEPFSFLSEDGLGWHDKISNTAVIKL